MIVSLSNISKFKNNLKTKKYFFYLSKKSLSIHFPLLRILCDKILCAMALENCRLNEILLPSKEFSFQKRLDLYHFTASCETIAHLTFFCCVIKGFILVPVTLSYSRIDSES